MKGKIFYKLARLDGFDFLTGDTINYRESIGKTVRVPQFDKTPQLCSDSVLHACVDPNDCFVGAKIPCSCFRVTGKPVIDDGSKCGFKEFRVIEEIPQDRLDGLFGWKYAETCNPLNPLKIVAPKVGSEVLELLQKWGSVWASVWASVRASVWASVWDSEYAYIGSLFPKIEKWKYVQHEKGVYPFQSCVDLLRLGFVPSFDSEKWRLHGGENAKTLYEICKADLEAWKQ